MKSIHLKPIPYSKVSRNQYLSQSEFVTRPTKCPEPRKSLLEMSAREIKKYFNESDNT